MPEGGKLVLRTARVPAAAGSTDGESVVVEVADSGIGMSEETRRRCLEPFYTTKGERGTGLGLAMVYGMIQRHSAECDISSELGRGTSVRLVFAAATTNATPEVVLPASHRPPRRLNMLVVDDDPLLIKSLQDILESDGHAVTTADGGEEGIACFTSALADGQQFDVVITDLGMPYVDGRKVATAIKTASPTTPVIMLTGWGKRLLADNDIPADVDRVLSKPPRLAELRGALSELVEATDTAS
jgi:CheY-like chemotaxis protein